MRNGPATERGSGDALALVEAGPFHVGRTRHRAGLVLGAHAHRHACLHVVTGGEYRERTGAQGWGVGRGRALLKPPGIRHWNRFDAETVSLRVDFPAEAAEAHGVTLPAAPVMRDDARIGPACDAILAELAAADDCAPMSLHGLCLHLLALVVRVPAPRAAAETSARVLRCQAYLRDRFRERLCFATLAREVGVSRTHLATVFRRETGTTLGEFVRRLRVEHAARLLESTGRPLADVALDAGFSDQSHLTRVFRRRTGRTPAAWRAARRG